MKNTPAKYDYLRYCVRCGQDEGWYPVIGDGYGQRCPVHGYLLRIRRRYVSKKQKEVLMN